MSESDSNLRTRHSLLLRIRAVEDHTAWNEFVKRYGPLILGWCRRWGLQDSDAEDVTQNVLLKLAGRLKSFEYDPTQRFRGYLKTIAQHASHDYFDAKARAGVGSGGSDAWQQLNVIEAQEDLANRLESAFDLELLEAAQERVRERVEPHTWEAFRLMALEGKSGAEVAGELKIQVGTAFKAKSKVQQMLREEIERLEAET